MNPLIIAALAVAVYLYLKNMQNQNAIDVYKNSANQSLVIVFRNLKGFKQGQIEVDQNSANTVTYQDSEKNSFQGVFKRLPDNRILLQAIENGYVIGEVEGDWINFYTYAKEKK